MTEKRKSPALRFRGYTDDWEQRKLGDIGETYTGLSGKTKADFGHGQARFVTYMNVFSNPISNPEMTEPIEIDPKQNEVEVGDVFFTTSSETPEEVGMSSVLLEKRGKTYLNSFCFGFRPSEKIDSYYLAYMLRSESARERIILLAQGISRYNISKNKVMEIAVSLPSLDEQKLIGQYFRQLDNLITLHQRKLEKLKLVKKSMLEKMFPKNGSSVPEIRFKGFTDDWEQRKFGDLYTPLTERNAELLPYSRTLSVATMEYKTSGNGAADSSLANYKRLRIGDIAFEGHTSRAFRYGRFVLNDAGDGIMSPRFSALRPLVQMPTKFWKYYVHYEPIMRNVLVNSTKAGTMMNELVVDEFLKSSILVPSEGEQTCIGNALTTLDNLITLHQRKVEKLQIMKKSMLEKMFV